MYALLDLALALTLTASPIPIPNPNPNQGEGVGFCDLKRTSLTIASGVDAVLVLALISEFDYYPRVGSYGVMGH